MGVVRALLSALRRPLLACLIAGFPSLAIAQAGTVTLGVGAFTNETDGMDVESEFAADGLADTLITQLVSLLQDGQDFAWCPGGILEVRRRQDILDELAFQQTKYVDKRTAATHTTVPDPDLLIEGSVRTVLGKSHWTVHVREKSGGPDVFTLEGDTPFETLYDAAEQLAHNILDLTCPKGYNVTGGGPRIEITGQIVRVDEQFELRGKFPGGSAVFIYTPTSRSGGTVRYALTGGGVSGSGEGTYVVADADGGGDLIILQDTNGCIHGVPNSCKNNNERLTLTPMFK